MFYIFQNVELNYCTNYDKNNPAIMRVNFDLEVVFGLSTNNKE